MSKHIWKDQSHAIVEYPAPLKLEVDVWINILRFFNEQNLCVQITISEDLYFPSL